MGSFLSRPPVWKAQGKTVVITGASRGIGAELARTFAKEQAKLILVARSKGDLDKVAEECRKLGAPEVNVFPCDLTKNDDIKSFSEAATKSMGLDVVILNAGRSQGCTFEEIQDVDQIDHMMKLNATGVFITLHYLLPHVYKSRHSRIVVISSIGGIISGLYRTIYCASKHALTGFFNSLRQELNDTYKAEAPTVSLMNLPAVRGTDVNIHRMDFGSPTTPRQWDPDDIKALDLSNACQAMYLQIVAGTRDWGQTIPIRILLILAAFLPAWVDRFLTSFSKQHTDLKKRE
jgi:short-subunit dehydrogenase